MTDELDDLIRKAIAQNVDEARPPRPFSALPGDGRQNRQRWFDVGLGVQRYVLAGSIAAIALLIGGLAVVTVGSDRATIESGPADVGSAPASETTEPTEPTAPTTTAPPTTTTTPVVGEFVVEMVCGDGHVNEVLVPHSTLGPFDFSPIDDAVNGIDVCEGASGGLASIQFIGCEVEPFLIEIDAIEGGIPDFSDFDICED